MDTRASMSTNFDLLYSRLKLNCLMQIRTIRMFNIDGRTYWNQTFSTDLSSLVLRAHNLGDYHEHLQRCLYLYIWLLQSCLA